MNIRRKHLISELQQLIAPNKSEFCIGYQGKYYRFQDCGEKFLPRKGVEGVGEKSKRMDQVYQIGGVKIYF